MDDRDLQALAIAVGWIVVALVVRWFGRRAFARWGQGRPPEDTARARTAYAMLERLALVIVFVVGAWSVLELFDVPATLGRALLASGAVLAVFAGAALATPLGNLGSGVIVAFAQPVRLDDRVTVGDATGYVVAIGLVYTVLQTDDNRHVYVPNTQLTASSVVNRTIKDPRRTVSASVPIGITAPIDTARSVVLEAMGTLPIASDLDLTVTVGEVSDRVVWLSVTALAPPDADVTVVASDVRERALGALRGAELLPT